MRTTSHRRVRGMTLIEISLAMTLGLVVAGMLMALVNQQVAFLGLFHRQSFLMDDAPLISVHVGRITGKADRFRLHGSINDALGNREQRLTDSPVLHMTFQQPDGTARSALLVFETLGGVSQLNYYLIPEAGTTTLGAPSWSISKRLGQGGGIFRMQNGILRMTVRGPTGEEITYSGTMQQ